MIPFRAGNVSRTEADSATALRGQQDTAAMQAAQSHFASEHRRGPGQGAPVGTEVRVLGVGQAYAGSAYKSQLLRRLPHRAPGENPGGTGRTFGSRGGKAKRQCAETAAPHRAPACSRSLYPLPGAARASLATCGSTSSGESRALDRGSRDDGSAPCGKRFPHGTCGGMDGAHSDRPPARAPGFEPRAPLTMWQPMSHAWLAHPPLAWCEPLVAARQRMAGPAEYGHERQRDSAPAKGAGERSSPCSSVAS